MKAKKLIPGKLYLINFPTTTTEDKIFSMFMGLNPLSWYKESVTIPLLLNNRINNVGRTFSFLTRRPLNLTDDIKKLLIQNQLCLLYHGIDRFLKTPSNSKIYLDQLEYKFSVGVKIFGIPVNALDKRNKIYFTPL